MAPGLLSRKWPSLSSRGIVIFVMIGALFEVSLNFGEMRRVSLFLDDKALSPMAEGIPTTKNHKTTVAYAVTVTKFKLSENKNNNSKHIDRAAVLHQSIKLAMQKSLRYDYHIYAFVHPDAIDAKPLLERLGYRVQVRDTPFNITEIRNFDLVDGQRIGCCGDKEYLKLYSYLLLDYPVVVHLDLDTIVLRPMDEVFDFMVLTQTTTTKKISVDQVESFAKTSTMWMDKTFNVSLSHSSRTILENPEQINFMFTRDYNMVEPPKKKPYQIGVQGGFLVIRPNQRDFDRMVEIIRAGGDFQDSSWGGEELGYGGYYGAATIQGLASYYYDYHENATRSIELNRCNYNTMVDEPIFFNKKLQKNLCTTLEDECEDCRKTKLEDVYTSHFTVCGKPEYCMKQENRLCEELLQEWHKTRLSLELEWMKRFSSTSFPYVPELKHVDPTESRGKHLESQNMGHCDGDRYISLLLPATTNSNNETDALI
jgi:hypothetical protein